ncbi:hypothetical protein BGI41_02625 [Methanobrevibacter sp. 87.7]|uniref:hypothetical protein n=1 Tax=Methanobrevibacter sp. 87.7 TaxID=387957 RepID=UPI000B510B30|nr:hypothetical protein [Methanobrevibacter sp. 87.7]OWT33383.1 hypothetical protein BGI41_02625 [Methanobrevibacter sp. 87.7]
MNIVTTPMCKKILDLAGVKDYNIAVHPSSDDGDFAILLSESKVDIDSLKIKLNTFQQILESIIKVSKYSDKKLDYDSALKFFEDYTFAYSWLCDSTKVKGIKEENSKINVSVKSKFLKDIVSDMNFNIDDNNFDYLIYPDYMEVNKNLDCSFVSIPTHHNVPKDPIERAELRYAILLNISHF